MREIDDGQIVPAGRLAHRGALRISARVVGVEPNRLA